MEFNQQIPNGSGAPIENPYTKILQVTRDSFGTGRTKNLKFREKQLRNLLRLFEENGDAILQALYKDLRKSKEEGTLSELELCKAEIIYMLGDLRKFAADEKVPFNWITCMENGFIRREPYGTVLIIGSWNYPILLNIKPLIGAIAAGNCVILKPSEVSVESAKILADLLPRYIDPECYPVVLADVEHTIKLLENKFDYIFYTGSTPVGASILKQAAPYLTPVTLELGGKSPCFLDDNINFFRAAKRIMWGKLLNMGQTCIAPDYILCSEKAQRAFITHIGQIMKEWYGVGNLQKKPELPRIINQRHFLRVKKLLDSTRGTIVLGGKTDEQDLWVEPTIVINVKADDPLMGEEIFGPILPIFTVNSPEDAIDFIVSRPKPLALYLFSSNSDTVNKMLDSIPSGGSCVNDVNLHNALKGLPFGGIGSSGMGNYHGQFSFDTFSHKRGILVRGLNFVSEKTTESRYPPYTKLKVTLVSLYLRYLTLFEGRVSLKSVFTHLFTFIIGAVMLFLVLHFAFDAIDFDKKYGNATVVPSQARDSPVSLNSTLNKLFESFNPDRLLGTG